MMEVLQSLKAPLMIPMHYLQPLHARPVPRPRAPEMGGGDGAIPSLVVSKTSLPATPKVRVCRADEADSDSEWPIANNE